MHILSGDLILHKRTLEPIKTVIYGLRRYDVDRVAALFPPGSKETAVGFMSHRSKIYLVHLSLLSFLLLSNSFQADVLDHMDYILTNLDMFAGIGQTLIDYTFNVCPSSLSFYIYPLKMAQPDISDDIQSDERNDVRSSSCRLPVIHSNSNSYRRRLTSITIIVLPLSFLTGYFVRPFSALHACFTYASRRDRE